MMPEQLSDNSIIIRKFDYSDIDPLYEAVRESIEEVSKWLPWCHPEYSKRETIDWFNFQADAWFNAREFNFAVVEKNTNRFIGGCGLNQIDYSNKLGNLGYWIRSADANKGYATKAAKLGACFGFEHLKLNRIEILMATGNTASKRVAEKIGAHPEGILRNRILLHDVPNDAYLFSLIPDDMEKHWKY